MNWKVYNVDNSDLPQNSVTSIALDSSGNKWIGTRDGGLAKFDGTSWIVYNTSNSGLPKNGIRSLAIDGSGNKWIGTYDGGVARFDDTNWTVYDTSNSGLTDPHALSLEIDNSGAIWIGTYYGGLVKFNGTNWTMHHISNSGLRDLFILSIAVDGSGNKWIGTALGLAVFNEGGIVSTKEIDESVSKTEYKNALYQRYPYTWLSYSVSKPGHAHVVVKVFDIKGRTIRNLVNAVKPAGIHQINFDSRNISNGTYFVNLKVGSNSFTKRLILMK